MARKRKRKKTPAARVARPARVSTSLRSAIQSWNADRKAEQPEPSTEPEPRTPATERPEAASTPRGHAPTDAERGPTEGDLDERAALAKAMEGVRPLARARKKRSPDASATPTARAHHVRNEAARQDALARDRMDALVGGGIRFSIERDDNYVRGRRDGSHPRVPHRLGSDTCRPHAKLDLHGLTREEARREVVRFVRAQRSRGARRVLIIHGKGNHSDSGRGVLADAAIEALTEGGAAPAVEAFSTAAPVNGGSGALVVQLV